MSTPKPRDEDGRFISELDVKVYKIDVWNWKGDVVKTIHEASERELIEIEEQYGDNPYYSIHTELL